MVEEEVIKSACPPSGEGISLSDLLFPLYPSSFS